MSITKLDDGRYRVDIRPAGRNGRRVRKIFDRKAEASAFEKYTLVNAQKNEWAGKKRDRRTLMELLNLWWEYHGKTREHGEKEKKRLINTIAGLGNISISALTRRDILRYRATRLDDDIKATSINREIYTLSGMLTQLAEIGEFSGENPIRGLGALPELIQEMSFLSKCEIAALLNALTGDARLVALVALSTGGRWTEVVSLKRSRIVNCRITYLKTKNGKRRTVPISEELENEILSSASGQLFDVDYRKFCEVLKQIKPDIPPNQATHILRHTFASHFMMNGGNIIALQQILGHASITQTMIYAHLSPDYLQNAIAMGPLAGGLTISV